VKIAVIKYNPRDISVNKVYRIVDLEKMQHDFYDATQLTTHGWTPKANKFIYLNLEYLDKSVELVYHDLVKLYDEYIMDVELGKLINKI
jgi:hypothetical protein